MRIPRPLLVSEIAGKLVRAIYAGYFYLGAEIRRIYHPHANFKPKSVENYFQLTRLIP